MTAEDVKREIEKRLNDLSVHFTKECELTFIMRHRTNPKCYIIVSNDNLHEVVNTIKIEQG